MRAINLNDYNYLVHNDLVMKTKKGMPWRCGKGFRRDWNKLIGMAVMFSGKPYTLKDRVKKNNRWYLMLKDGDLVIIKRQDTVTMKSTDDTTGEQLCLPPSRTPIDFIIENELNPLIARFNNDVKLKKYKCKPIPIKCGNVGESFESRLDYMDINILKLANRSKYELNGVCKDIIKKCMLQYHPDRTHEDTNNEFTLLSSLYQRITPPKPQSTTKKKSNNSKKSKKGRKVEMVDLNTGEVLKVFDCTGDANEYFGKRRSATSINNCILGKSKQAYGYKWRYAS